MIIIERSKALNCFKIIKTKLIEKRDALNIQIEEFNEYSEDSLQPIDSYKYMEIAKKALIFISEEEFTQEENIAIFIK